MRSDPVIGLAVALAVLAVTTFAGLLWRRRDGRLRQIMDPPSGATVPVVPVSLGVPAGAVVTLLQFSSKVCAPCRAAHRVLSDLASQMTGVVHVEVDAEHHLDAARELGVWRTPTVLVLDSTGRVQHRASGVPAAGELRAAIAPMLVAG